MTLQRYGSWDELPISEIGEWLRLDDVIKLLEDYCDGNHSIFDNCDCSYQIALIKGEK